MFSHLVDLSHFLILACFMLYLMSMDKQKIESLWTPHYYNRKSYNEAAFLAQYYRWLAAHGMDLAGNDPLTGRPRCKAMQSWVNREESILVHKVQAKYWLQRAKLLRRYGEV